MSVLRYTAALTCTSAGKSVLSQARALALLRPVETTKACDGCASESAATRRRTLALLLQRDQPSGSWPAEVPSKDSVKEDKTDSNLRGSSSSRHGIAVRHFGLAIRISEGGQGSRWRRILGGRKRLPEEPFSGEAQEFQGEGTP